METVHECWNCRFDNGNSCKSPDYLKMNSQEQKAFWYEYETWEPGQWCRLWEEATKQVGID